MESRDGVAYLTAEEMAEFDRAAIEDNGIDEILLMENAGAAVARVSRMMLGGSTHGKKVTFLVGKGNNGGDALVAARRLSNWGADVELLLGEERAGLRGAPSKQLSILENMGVVASGPEGRGSYGELVVDGLFGYNLRGDPREPAASMIRQANSSGVPILAVDVPSGLDATTGVPGNPSIVATATVTLGLPKAGFLSSGAKGYVGQLYLADLSFPRAVYRRHSQDRELFVTDSLVRIW